MERLQTLGIEVLPALSILSQGLGTPAEFEGHLPQHLFSGFPRGWAGIALLLLRAVVGILLLFQGSFYAAERSPTPGTWFVGLIALASGAMLVVGLLTPIVAVVMGLCVLGVEFSFLPVCGATVFDGKVTVIEAATILTAIVFLGPGAFSLDSRLFGRREIIIPPSPRR